MQSPRNSFAPGREVPAEAPPQRAASRWRIDGLHFEPKLEHEYRLHMRADQRTSTLVCLITALGIWLIFIGLDLGTGTCRSRSRCGW